MTIPSLGVDSPYMTHGTPGGDSRVTSSLVNLTPEHTAILSDSILRKVLMMMVMMMMMMIMTMMMMMMIITSVSS